MARARYKKNKRSTLPTTPAIPLADGALLVALVTVLAFQGIRVTPYEAEKVGLLGILAVLIIIGTAGLWISKRNLPDRSLIPFHPLSYAVLGLVIVTLISTIFSLSPARSLWGSPFRVQGLVTTFIYLILFWGATRTEDTTRAAIIPVLLTIMIPISVFALVERSGLDPFANISVFGGRVSSTAGNPNYLAGWLSMALLYTVPQLIREIIQMRRPFAMRDQLLVGLYALPIILAFITLIFTGSRGALLGLGAGTVLLLTLLIAHYRKPALLGLLAVGIILLIGGYTIASNLTESSTQDTSIERLLVNEDDTRAKLWTDTAYVLSQQSEPLFPAKGLADGAASLRPFIGYGPETADYLHMRYSESGNTTFAETTFIDRAHNLLLDARLSTGWLGLIAWVAVFGTAFVMGLRSLQGQKWVSATILFPALTVVMMIIVFLVSSGNGLTIYRPALFGVGGYLAAVITVGVGAFRQGDAPHLTPSEMGIMTILALVAAYWIDNQFGFMQAATQPLFWIMLGILVNLTIPKPLRIVSQSFPTAYAWKAGGIVAGLFVIHSLSGTYVDIIQLSHLAASSFTEGGILILLGLYILAALALHGTLTRSRILPTVGVILLMWIGFGLLRWMFFRAVSSGIAERSAYGSLAGALAASFPLFALAGIMLLVLAVGMWIAPSWRLIRSQYDRVALGVMVLVLLGASIGYGRDYTASTLEKFIVAMTSNITPDVYVEIDEMMINARKLAPHDTSLMAKQLQWMAFAIQNTGDLSDQGERWAVLNAEADRIMEAEPYFVHTKVWQSFFDRYIETEGDVE